MRWVEECCVCLLAASFCVHIANRLVVASWWNDFVVRNQRLVKNDNTGKASLKNISNFGICIFIPVFLESLVPLSCKTTWNAFMKSSMSLGHLRGIFMSHLSTNQQHSLIDWLFVCLWKTGKKKNIRKLWWSHKTMGWPLYLALKASQAVWMPVSTPTTCLSKRKRKLWGTCVPLWRQTKVCSTISSQGSASSCK